MTRYDHAITKWEVDELETAVDWWRLMMMNVV
jgi:hypothetical protein